ncbi:MAG: protein kinase [Phycisphaerae bacterium]|nr:protein kinase [Phycisphaerae bacterium]
MTSENNNLQHSGQDDGAEVIGALINEFFDRREGGEPLTEERFLAEHAEHAAVLREHFESIRLLPASGSSEAPKKLPGDETVDLRGSSATAEPPDSQHFPRIDGYQISRLIGRGGMGIVYKAVQISTKRQVALKVLLEGPLASDQSRKRFEREIEVAAQLRHSNIIPIYDSGKCEGRMYYAMAYIKGVSLTDFLTANRLSFNERLTLFAKICGAVRHAHQRGVMHRDLKPTNILVDAEGEPHVLDFGLAKISALSDLSMSVSAQIVGTPAYMSPEQAAGDPAGVDTRTDIYSLGVVLYEMMVGKMPYDTAVSMGRVLDNIAHAEPTPPHLVDRKVTVELSAIMMKALEKSKDRRYQSIDILLSDIDNYLKGNPISVRPPTIIYFMRKTIWRHRAALGSIAAVLMVAASVVIFIRGYSKDLRAQNQNLEQQKREIAQERERVVREKQELELQRDSKQEELNRVYAWLNSQDPVIAENLKSFATGVTNPYRLPELIAQGAARGLTPTPSKPISKLDEIDAQATIVFEAPSFSTKPAPTEETTDFLSRIGKVAEDALTKGVPSVINRSTSQPAPTSQPSKKVEPLSALSQIAEEKPLPSGSL